MSPWLSESLSVRAMRPQHGKRRPSRRQWTVAEVLEERTLLSGMAVSDIPFYQSNPGAPVVILLDFDGHSESKYGDFENISIDAYNHIGSDENTFDQAEQDDIWKIWKTVAEDFSPFNVNVVTRDPAELDEVSLAEWLSSAEDPSAEPIDYFANGVGLRVVIGGSSHDLEQGFEAGGFALSFAFTNSAPNVVFSFQFDATDLTSMRHVNTIADTASHEAGHAFGLQHQAEYDENGQYVSSYEPGTETKAPIMGTRQFIPKRTTWTIGPTPFIVNEDGDPVFSDRRPGFQQDDMQILAAMTQADLPQLYQQRNFQPNGFGYRVDDHGDFAGDSSSLTVTDGRWRGKGVIEQTTDVDYFTFVVVGEPGELVSVQIDVKVNDINPNLDAFLEIRDYGGNLVVPRINPTGDTIASLNAATQGLKLAPGEYRIVVGSHGEPGDVGQYTVTAREGGGPKIVEHYMSPDRLRVVFNEKIDADSFTADDVVIIAGDGVEIPQSQISIVPVNGTDRWFDIVFPAYSTTDGIRVEVGPQITDRFNNKMNQNGDFASGRSDDKYIVEDFAGPRVTKLELFAGKIEVTFNEAIDPNSFTASEITTTDPNGNNVPLFSNPVALSDNQFEIAIGSYPVGGFDLTIAPVVRDSFGNLMNQDQDDVNGEPMEDRYHYSIRDDEGPRVLGAALAINQPLGPWGTLSPQGASILLTFDESIDPTSFTTQDVSVVQMIRYNAGFMIPKAVDVVSVTEHSGSGFDGSNGPPHRHFLVTFLPEGFGDFYIVVGPHITDLFGNNMNQDEDGVNGEQLQDQFRWNFEIEPTVYDGVRGFIDPRAEMLFDRFDIPPMPFDPGDPAPELFWTNAWVNPRLDQPLEMIKPIKDLKLAAMTSKEPLKVDSDIKSVDSLFSKSDDKLFDETATSKTTISSQTSLSRTTSMVSSSTLQSTMISRTSLLGASRFGGLRW